MPYIFKPTQKQIELLKAWADPEIKPTITAVCERIGISRPTYYEWFDNQDFVNWWNEAWHREMANMESYLDNVGMKKLTQDFRYWEALQMKYHKYARKEEVKQDIKKTLDLSKLTDEELQKLLELTNKASDTGGDI